LIVLLGADFFFVNFLEFFLTFAGVDFLRAGFFAFFGFFVVFFLAAIGAV